MALVRIPEGLNHAHFDKIREIQENILSDIKGARRVGIRLNKTDTTYPSPVFVGILEDATMRTDRVRRGGVDPGHERFRNEDFSVIYNQTVSDPQGKYWERDWNEDNDCYEKTLGGLRKQGNNDKGGVRYQIFIAIRIADGACKRSIGILGIGLDEKPQDMRDVGAAMIRWAQSNSELVQHITNTYKLGGPLF